MSSKFKSAIYWFILAQPFLDIYWLYQPPLADLFPFSLPTIVRLIGMGVIIALYFSEQKNWRKLQQKWIYLIYFACLLVYSLLHIYHTSHFISISPTNYGYSTFGELFYLLRLCLPLILIFLTTKSKLDRQTFYRAITILASTMSLTIVVTNLFCISIQSYGSDFISGNIFSWFFGSNVDYFSLASKGFFNFANTISAILFMLTPLLAYIYVQTNTWTNFAVLAIHCLAMVELGTKVATYGALIGLIALLLAAGFHALILKNFTLSKRALLMLSLLILLTAGLAKKGPALMRNQFEAEIIDQREGDDEDDEDDLPKDRVSQEDLLKKLTAGERKYQTRSARHRFYLRFIKKYETSLSINPRFLNKSYPYKRDPEFWIAQIKKPVSVQLNNRVMETEMLNQVKQANHNSLDKWLGIGFTRQSNIFTLERDFLSQNYSLGVIGVLLLLVPYLGVLLYTALSWLLKAQNRTLEITALIAAQTFILAAAYMSGNVLDSLTATFILAFIDGFTLLQLKQARM